MLILIEGMERCGKSSTVNHIREVLHNPKLIVHHSSKPPKTIWLKDEISMWSNIHYTSVLEKFAQLSNAGWDIVMDRAHIGEYVYGNMYRGNSLTEDYMFWGERYLNQDDTYLILLTDDPQKVILREDGNSMSKNIIDISFERNRFIEGFNKSSIKNKLHIDWTNDNVNKILDFKTLFTKYTHRLNDFLEIF